MNTGKYQLQTKSSLHDLDEKKKQNGWVIYPFNNYKCLGLDIVVYNAKKNPETKFDFRIIDDSLQLESLYFLAVFFFFNTMYSVCFSVNKKKKFLMLW